MVEGNPLSRAERGLWRARRGSRAVAAAARGAVSGLLHGAARHDARRGPRSPSRLLARAPRCPAAGARSADGISAARHAVVRRLALDADAAVVARDTAPRARH